MWWTTAPRTTRWNETDLNNSPVLVVDDGVDERVVDGGGFCYDCRDSLGVRRQDVGVPEMRQNNAITTFRHVHLVVWRTPGPCHDSKFHLCFSIFCNMTRGHIGSGISQNVPAVTDGWLSPSDRAGVCKATFSPGNEQGKDVISELRNYTPSYIVSPRRDMWFGKCCDKQRTSEQLHRLLYVTYPTVCGL